MDSLWRAVDRPESAIRDGLGRVDQAWLADLPPAVSHSRVMSFCVLAIKEAMKHAGWTSLDPDDGLIIATTTGQFLQWQPSFVKHVKGELDRGGFRQDFVNQPLDALARNLQGYFEHTGPFTVVTSACTAATQALALGALWLKQGRVKRVLVGGAEVLCDLTTEGFKSLQLLSSAPATPFDRSRKGINLSEGAAFLCMERECASPLAAVSGIGFTTDGHHMTAPHPQGEGSYQAMMQALRHAGAAASDVDWVHAHGTGSVHNDAAEGLAVSRVFGEQGPVVSSTKWIHGHALGASGAIETALVVRAMNEGRILHTRGLQDPDESIPLRHARKDVFGPVNMVLKNTLGFGGANSAVLLTRGLP
jgi:3-oxoacyl-[acyl-carrier-protein] synthase-1